MREDNELFELCRIVYERTKWQPVDWRHGDENGQPLYTSDYILEKLPNTVELKKRDDGSYSGLMPSIVGRLTLAKSPLKALLKLTIALSEAGELQASEDTLTYGVDRGIPGGGSTALSIKKGSTLFTFAGDKAVAIIDVIRTEKLKLLAEVRERAEMVVGNVSDPSGKYVSVSEVDELEAEL